MTNESNHQYDDIIDLPHHVSATRPRMSMIDRAAQFSPSPPSQVTMLPSGKQAA